MGVAWAAVAVRPRRIADSQAFFMDASVGRVVTLVPSRMIRTRARAYSRSVRLVNAPPEYPASLAAQRRSPMLCHSRQSRAPLPGVAYGVESEVPACAARLSSP